MHRVHFLGSLLTKARWDNGKAQRSFSVNPSRPVYWKHLLLHIVLTNVSSATEVRIVTHQ